MSIGTGILAKYTYDILGRITQKIDYTKSTTNPESTVYIYNGDNIQSEYMTTSILVNGTGTLTPITLKKNYLNSIGTDSILAYDNEERISLTSTGKTTVRYYYHTNQLGSVIAISTSTGQVVQKYTYNAYGKPYIYSGSTLTALSSYTGTLYGNTRLYTGREYDRETGYYYNRARIYSSDLGRFLSRDPIGQNDQVNLYTYVRNSPLNYTDRTGEFFETAWDVGNTIYDVGRGVKNLAEVGYEGAKYGYASVTGNTCLKKQALAGIKQDASELGEASLDIAFDGLATVIPFMPAGGTKALRMGAKIEKKLKGAANPKVKEAAAKGRQMHKEYNPFNNPETKEFTIPGYGRADAVDVKNFVVRELKPNNPTAIKKGEKQLQRYIEGLEEMIPESKGLWKPFLDTYN